VQARKTSARRAPRRLKALLESATYLEADRDVEFLNHDDTRGLRLQLEYLKAESVLRRQRIGHTILVLGSSHIAEQAAARRHVDRLRRAAASNANRRRVAIAERLLAKSHYYEVARQFGRLVAEAGERAKGVRGAIVTGGGPGVMEAANRGAYEAGGPSLGLNISLPRAQYPNSYISPELCLRFRYFALRKLHFLLRARALVAFPGGFGTFDELFETLTLVQTSKIKPLPIVLVGEAYWRRAFDADFLVAEGVINERDRKLFRFAETPREIWDGIVRWYRRAGEPVFPPYKETST
jgi:uncharacterized protein (TIGR00730 family)